MKLLTWLTLRSCFNLSAQRKKGRSRAPLFRLEPTFRFGFAVARRVFAERLVANLVTHTKINHYFSVCLRQKINDCIFSGKSIIIFHVDRKLMIAFSILENQSLFFF